VPSASCLKISSCDSTLAAPGFAHLIGHRARVFADDDAAVAMAFQRQYAERLKAGYLAISARRPCLPAPTAARVP
jgi:hypothetical protein